MSSRSASMIAMNLKLSEVITKHDNTEYVAKSNSKEIASMRERLHQIEGYEKTVIEMIKKQQ